MPRRCIQRWLRPIRPKTPKTQRRQRCGAIRAGVPTIPANDSGYRPATGHAAGVPAGPTARRRQALGHDRSPACKVPKAYHGVTESPEMTVFGGHRTAPGSSSRAVPCSVPSTAAVSRLRAGTKGSETRWTSAQDSHIPPTRKRLFQDVLLRPRLQCVKPRLPVALADLAEEPLRPVGPPVL